MVFNIEMVGVERFELPTSCSQISRLFRNYNRVCQKLGYFSPTETRASPKALANFRATNPDINTRRVSIAAVKQKLREAV